MKPVCVIALGGNAIIKRGEKYTIYNQIKNIGNAIKPILALINKYSLVLTHGSGPEVGELMLISELARKKIPPLPLDVLDAEVQGWLGYLIQQQLNIELTKHNINKPAITLITQVLVSKNDPAFKNPSKPVGPFYNKKHSLLLSKKGYIIKKVDSNSYRRIVPSPQPLKIIEVPIIRALVKNDIITIAAGGGGIPVYKENNKLHGIDAVIDKDLASSLLASSIKANLFIILTDVPCVYLDYKTKKQRALKKLTIKQAIFHLKQNQFPVGSMGPKIQASINFLSNKGKKVIITNPENLQKALNGKAGTIITN